jgi:hypothetical protein
LNPSRSYQDPQPKTSKPATSLLFKANRKPPSWIGRRFS